MKEKGKRKKIEASKKIIVVNYMIFIGVVIATFTALFKGIELSSIIPFDMGILGLITAANAHYYSKSRQENLTRIAKAYELDEGVLKDLLLEAMRENVGTTNNSIGTGF